eukprot:490464-Prorocentrum_minimum.AAC.5
MPTYRSRSPLGYQVETQSSSEPAHYHPAPKSNKIFTSSTSQRSKPPRKSQALPPDYEKGMWDREHDLKKRDIPEQVHPSHTLLTLQNTLEPARHKPNQPNPKTPINIFRHLSETNLPSPPPPAHVVSPSLPRSRSHIHH